MDEKSSHHLFLPFVRRVVTLSVRPSGYCIVANPVSMAVRELGRWELVMQMAWLVCDMSSTTPKEKDESILGSEDCRENMS